MRFSKWLVSSLLGLGCLSACADPGADAPTPEQLRHAQELAQSALVADTHIDVPYRIHDRWEDVSGSATGGEFDYPRAMQGGLNLPFMSIYTPAELEAEGGSYQLANELIDSMEALVYRAPDKFVIVRSPAEAEAAKAAGKIGLALGMENGSPIEGKLENLEFFFDRGVRYITLAHGLSNHISDSSYDKKRQWNGLSPFGRQVVAEMNRLGIIVDISHVSDEAFFQAVELSAVPAIASHSSARHFTPGFERNMSDEMIVKLAEHGGVIQVNYASSFLTREANEWQVAMAEARTAWVESTGNDAESDAAKDWLKAYRDEKPFPYASISDVADHIDHVVQLTSYENVGIGSDFDGVGDSLPVGLKDVSTYPALIAELIRRGYTDEQLVAMLGGNTLRVWRQVEDYAHQQQAAQAPAGPVGLANPAAVYCHYLGGKDVRQTADDGSQSASCQLPNGQACDQWALFRGSCSLDAEISQPFEYCHAAGNTPVLPVPAVDAKPLLPSALLAAMSKQGLASADAPAEVQGAARWRCMGGAVWVCPVGANLPCGEQADDSTTPTAAMSEYCAGNPDSDFLPAYVTGRATVFNWSCQGTAAVAGEQQFHADAQGYLAEFWKELKP